MIISVYELIPPKKDLFKLNFCRIDLKMSVTY